jgi:hypothetical protein
MADDKKPKLTVIKGGKGSGGSGSGGSGSDPKPPAA